MDNGIQQSADEAQAPFLARLWDPRTARVLTTTLIFLLVLGFFRAAKETLILFLFAILFAYFLAPLVGRLERPMKGRGKAILIVYALLIGILVGLGFIVGPQIADETKDLANVMPSLINRLASGQILAQFGQNHHWSAARVGQVQNFVSSHKDSLYGFGRAAASKIAAPAQHIWWLILIPILSLFFLKEGEEMATDLVQMGRNPGERNVIQALLHDVNVMLGSYIRSQIILASLTLVAYTTVLGILRVPYAFVLGPAAGFLEFVPVVGPAVAAVSVFVIAVLAGYPHTLWLVVFLGLWRLVQDYVTAPRIMGKSLEIDPLVQIFAVLAGGEIAGVVGALISVPVVASLRIILRLVRSSSPAVTTPHNLPAGRRSQ